MPVWEPLEGRYPKVKSSSGSQSWMKPAQGAVMGRRAGACGYAGKTDLSPCGAGPQLSPCWRARQQWPFPGEDPRKIVDMGALQVFCSTLIVAAATHA